MMYRKEFYDALESFSVEKLEKIPKSDLHNHAARGGRAKYVEKCLGISIPENLEFSSIETMDKQIKHFMKSSNLPGITSYFRCVEASFVAAHEDCIVKLALDFGLGEVLAVGGMRNFIDIVDLIKSTFAPQIKFYPVIAIYNNKGIEYLSEILSYNWFDAIDIINYRKELTISDMKNICYIAKQHGVRTKAHIGEFGTADEVIYYVNELMLDEIQHGIAVAQSLEATKQLAQKKIVMNICPTSNIKLGAWKNYESHPIGLLYRNGINVTINTDDLLVFGSTVSEEYLKLFQFGTLNKDELYEIFSYGLLTYQ